MQVYLFPVPVKSGLNNLSISWFSLFIRGDNSAHGFAATVQSGPIHKPGIIIRMDGWEDCKDTDLKDAKSRCFQVFLYQSFSVLSVATSLNPSL
jgi:hypothetical protein